MTDPAATNEPPGGSSTLQDEPETGTKPGEEGAAAGEATSVSAVRPPPLHGLAAALALGGAACLAGGLMVFQDHREATPSHRTVIHRPARRATPAPAATPALARAEGIVVRYDGGSGVLVVRSGGISVVMSTGAATTYQSDCVAPAHLHPGQRIVVAVVGYSNGALNVQRIAPASGEACRSATTAQGMPRTPSPAGALPGTDTLPPRPDGNAGADGAAPPHP